MLRSNAVPNKPDEFAFIADIAGRARKAVRPTDLLCGIGDDAALLAQRTGRNTVITTDLLVEDIDFRRRYTPARALGHKSLAVSLSDIAAMGARPRWALLSVGVPANVWRTRFLTEFYDGFFALAARTGVALIGGDVSRTPERIVIDSIVLGETKRGRAILRTGAQPGDHIYVTGTLGGAAAGLQLLEAHKRGRRTHTHTQLICRQQQPEPRLAWGALLGDKRLATALIDLSDGLSSDLAHLCHASGVGALIEAAQLPVDPLITQAGHATPDALNLALHGGEDFELLFTARPQHAARLPRELDGVPITRIGEVRAQAEGIKVRVANRTCTLRSAGFTHFRAE